MIFTRVKTGRTNANRRIRDTVLLSQTGRRGICVQGSTNSYTALDKVQSRVESAAVTQNSLHRGIGKNQTTAYLTAIRSAMKRY